MRKLEQKREQRERKAETRRRKTVDGGDAWAPSAELESVKAERDAALRKAELLLSQVGELQAQNARLVAELGCAGAVTGKGDSLFGEGSAKGQPTKPTRQTPVEERHADT